MGYKKNDKCIQKAFDDERLFVLMTRDATAPRIVMEWIKENLDKQPEAKLREAFECALEMQRRGPDIRDRKIFTENPYKMDEVGLVQQGNGTDWTTSIHVCCLDVKYSQAEEIFQALKRSTSHDISIDEEGTDFGDQIRTKCDYLVITDSLSTKVLLESKITKTKIRKSMDEIIDFFSIEAQNPQSESEG